MNYWKTHQKDLIAVRLKEIFQRKLYLQIWQQKTSERNILEANMFFLDNQRLKIKFKPNPLYPIDQEIPVYVFVPEIEMVFKKDKFISGGDIIEMNLPNEIQVVEKRRNERFNYLYQDHKDITYYCKVTDEHGKEEIAFTHSSVLLDISIAGACMVVPMKNATEMTVGRRIYLANLTDQKLPTPFVCIVKYCFPYEADKKDHLFKVGISFESDLDSISYKSITSVIEIKRKKVRGIDPSRFCGMDYEEQVKVLNNIEAQNKVLANNIRDNIEYLDKLRYLTLQMKMEFLKSTPMDLLANALRLSSKELIYELFSNVTENLRQEFLDKLSLEKPASGICKAQDDVIKVVRAKEAKGEYVLDPMAFITYV